MLEAEIYARYRDAQIIPKWRAWGAATIRAHSRNCTQYVYQDDSYTWVSSVLTEQPRPIALCEGCTLRYMDLLSLHMGTRRN